MKPSIGIIGVGWVGEQVKRYFEEIRGYKLGFDLHIHDIKPEKCVGDIQKADIVFIIVPTQTNFKNRVCDISIVEGVVALLSGTKIIVIKSTVPPGTTEQLQKQYPHHKILFNPEFLTEKNAWVDFCNPDRQIVGYTEQSKGEALTVLDLLPKAQFFSPAPSSVPPRWITATEAELIKYAGNVFLAFKVNYANMIAKVVEEIGARYDIVREAVAADVRIGGSHLDVDSGGYRGFGGYCFPKDFSVFDGLARKFALHSVTALIGTNWAFNERLLHEQGLTVEDVGRHITEIEIKEKKANGASILKY